MAEHSKRVEENRAGILQLCKQVSIINIDIQTGIRYGEMKEELFKSFGPKGRSDRTKFRLESLGIWDNDLWLAASAISNSLVFVSADRHFDRIRSVRNFEIESWWQPDK